MSEESATDYSYYVISLTAMLKQYQNLVSQGKYEKATEVTIDMLTAVIRIKNWTEAQCTETPNY